MVPRPLLTLLLAWSLLTAPLSARPPAARSENPGPVATAGTSPSTCGCASAAAACCCASVSTAPACACSGVPARGAPTEAPPAEPDGRGGPGLVALCVPPVTPTVAVTAPRIPAGLRGPAPASTHNEARALLGTWRT